MKCVAIEFAKGETSMDDLIARRDHHAAQHQLESVVTRVGQSKKVSQPEPTSGTEAGTPQTLKETRAAQEQRSQAVLHAPEALAHRRRSETVF